MSVEKNKGVISLISSDAGSTAIYTGTLLIQAIFWDVGTSGAADDACSVTDNAGNRIFSAHAAAKDENHSLTFYEAIPITGLKVPTLGHGTLYIYVCGPFPVA